MKILDRIINKLAPQRALKNELSKAYLNLLNSGYGNHGANRYKKSMIGWNDSGGSADEDIHENISILRQRTRDLYMGAAPISNGAIKTLRTNVVGSGLKLKPQLNAQVLGLTEDEVQILETKIENEFSLWAESKNCDANKMNDFYELQQLAFLSEMLSGEVFVLLPYIQDRGVYGLSIQLVEADKVYTPQDKKSDEKIKYGIHLGKYDEPIAYYFHKKHPLSVKFGAFNEYKKIKAVGEKTGFPNVLHIFESERPGQLRGVPVLAPVIESLRKVGQYTDAELTAAVVSGFYSLFITRENDVGDFELGEAIPEGMRIDDIDPNSYELGPGSILALEPGEKVQEANPSRPNVAFDGFVTAILRQVGASLEIPYELLVKQFNSSYSASRASLLEAWKMFKMRRTWLANDFCNPVYEQWFSEAVAKGRINAPGFFTDPLIHKAYLSCEWSGPTQGQIDPLKEVNAAVIRVNQGFSTRARETIELTGGDYNRNIRQRINEEKSLRDVEEIRSDENSIVEEVRDGEED